MPVPPRGRRRVCSTLRTATTNRSGSAPSRTRSRRTDRLSRPRRDPHRCAPSRWHTTRRVDSLAQVTDEVVHCFKCPRLVAWREQVALEKRAAYRDWEYWGRPIPGFGDANARLLIVGLAPAA